MGGAPLRVLVVEDDEVDRLAFRRATRDTTPAIELVMATSVHEAGVILRKQKFDAVVTDFDLGDGSALDVIRLAGDSVSIVVAGAGDQGKAVKALKAGASDYIVKDAERSYLTALPTALATALQDRERDLRLRMLAHALRSIGDGVYVTSPEDEIVFVNPAFSAMYEYTAEEVVGGPSDMLWAERPGYDACPVADDSTEVTLRTKSGRTIPVALTRSRVRDEAGRVVAVVRVTRDITDRHRAEQALLRANAALEESRAALAELATKDELTGLYNRRELMRGLREEATRALRYRTALSFVLLDLDHFKSINDRYGHPAGDAVLRRIGHIVGSGLRVFDRAARYGGEELAVLLPNTPMEGAAVVAERLRLAIEGEGIDIGPDLPRVRVTASFGVATLGRGGAATEDMLVQTADSALYAAKASGRNRVVSGGIRRAA